MIVSYVGHYRTFCVIRSVRETVFKIVNAVLLADVLNNVFDNKGPTMWSMEFPDLASRFNETYLSHPAAGSPIEPRANMVGSTVMFNCAHRMVTSKVASFVREQLIGPIVDREMQGMDTLCELAE